MVNLTQPSNLAAFHDSYAAFCVSVSLYTISIMRVDVRVDCDEHLA